MVDVKDGKIIRLHPLHYDWKSSPEELGYWELEARGKKLRPTLKALVTPHNMVYKKRIYSPNRVMYPLKRVDWDPNGNRNTEKRGKESKYVRIFLGWRARFIQEDTYFLYFDYHWGPNQPFFKGYITRLGE